MANSYRHETLRGTAGVNGLQIATLIGNLSRSVEMLTVDIEHEETQAGVRDASDPAYPALAQEPEGARGEHQGDHRFARGGWSKGHPRQPRSYVYKLPLCWRGKPCRIGLPANRTRPSN
jgi:hypothetical protein